MPEDLDEFYSASARGMTRSLIRELLKLTRSRNIISFAGGLPDPSSFPVEELKVIAAHVLETQAHIALQYGPTEGDPRLREHLVKWMAKDGIRTTAARVLITTGSQQGLDLVGRVLLDPGDVVIVELPSYMAALHVFRSYRAEMIGVPQDDDGIRTDQLESTLASLRRGGRRPKFIYVVPDFQNPSGVTLAHARRVRLLELSRDYHTFVVEDTPYRELRFEGTAPPPLAALDTDGRVIYLSTFSKTLSPGLRIAWMAASEEFVQRFVTAKQAVDLCCPSLTQAIAAEFCARGHIYARIPTLVSLYRHKRDVMLAALEREMPDGVSWTHPAGGLFLWVRLPDGMDSEVLLRSAVEEEGVAYVVGAGFHADGGGRNALRLNFSYPSDAEIEEGIRRLARLVKRHLPALTTG